MNEQERLESLKKYMKMEFGITPENIDSELDKLKTEFTERLKLFEVKEAM